MRQRILVTSTKIAMAAGILLHCATSPAQQLVPVSPASPSDNSFSFESGNVSAQDAPAFTSPRGNKTATPRYDDRNDNNEFSSSALQPAGDPAGPAQPRFVDTGDPYAPSPNKFPGTTIPPSMSRINTPSFAGQTPSVTNSQSPVTNGGTTFNQRQPLPGMPGGQWQQISPSGQVTTLRPPTPPASMNARGAANADQYQPNQPGIATNAQGNRATFVPPSHLSGAGTINQQVTTRRNPIDPDGLLSKTVPGSANGNETILQRFPDGKIEIARQVTQDAQGNYVNHGIWKKFQQNGQLISAGTYQMGKRNGTWFRWHFVSESPLLHEAPYSEFTGPFLSRAVFREDQLDGPWTIYDKQQRIVSEIQLRDGARHGAAIWNFANGQKYREIMYRDGKIDGHFHEWNKQARPTRQVIFQQGRPLLREISWFDRQRGMKEVEANYLGGEVTLESPDDWLELQLATYTIKGEKQKHGSETVWYLNGQTRMKGQFEYGLPVGEFVWWHENGQKQLGGVYENGEQTAEWTWWHESGLKSIQGQYANNKSVGQWTWWNPSGEVARSRDFSIDSLEAGDQRESLAEGDHSETSPSNDSGVPLLRARQISDKRD